MSACRRNDHDLPSWSCEFDSRHPLQIIALVNPLSLCPSYSNTQMTRITRLVIRYSMMIDTDRAKCLVRRDFTGYESGQ